MDEALLSADRAVADGDSAEIGGDSKSHALAVTAAFVRSLFGHAHFALDTDIDCVDV